MNDTVIFDSSYYTLPEENVDYFRDGLLPYQTHDFVFFGLLLSCASDFLVHNSEKDDFSIVVFHSNSSTSLSFRFYFDSKLYFPLSGKKAEANFSQFQLAYISYSNLWRCFISRFYQYRLLETRQTFCPSPDYSSITGQQQAFSEYEYYLEELINTTQLLSYTATTQDNTANGISTYCVKDGWIEPETINWFNQNEIGVSYLICPHCLGNIDYQFTNRKL